MLCACIEAGSGERLAAGDVAAAMLDRGIGAHVAPCRALLEAYFTGSERDEKPEPKGSDGPVPPTFPCREFVGPAISLWGLSASEAWAMTVPEWWAACDAYAAAHHVERAGGDLSKARKRELAAMLRKAKREEMQSRE